MNKQEIRKWLHLLHAEFLSRDDPKEGGLCTTRKDCGVYALYFPEVGSVYFGSTDDLYYRRNHHLSTLRGGYHPNSNVQRLYDLNPDGTILFLFVVVQDREAAYDLEQSLLDGYWGSSELLNRWKNARVAGTGEMSEETKGKIANLARKRYENPAYREKMRTAMMRRYDDPAYRERMAAVFTNNLPIARKAVMVDGITYPSLTDAAKAHGMSKQGVKGRIVSKYFPNWRLV